MSAIEAKLKEDKAKETKGEAEYFFGFHSFDSADL